MKENIFGLFIKFVYISLGAWLFIHIFALFGIFISFAYLVLWFFIPQKLPCFICKINKKNCFTCKNVKTSSKTSDKRSVKSLIFNTLFLVTITFISAGLVFVESKLLFNLGLFPKKEYVTFSVPPRHQYKLGEVFPLNIEIKDISVPINAAQVDMAFDPQYIEVTSISEKDSFAKIFIEKTIDNDKGYARFSGGLPNPGYKENSGIFGTIYLKGRKPGLSELEFLPITLVLANDGKGTNITSKVDKAYFFILPEYLSNEELNKQGASVEPVVLGVSDLRDPDRLCLYNYSGVLGVDSINSNQPRGLIWKILVMPIDKFFNILHGYDTLVLKQWKEIISVFYVES